MSTIEKAAARLVKKKIEPTSDRQQVNEEVDEPAVSDTETELGVAPISVTVETAELSAQSSHHALGTASESKASKSNEEDESSVDTGRAPLIGAGLESETSDNAQYRHTCELDFPWLEENGFLVPNHKNHRQGQEFRRIKRPLLQNLRPHIAQTQARPTNLIYITSALPSEGKTFVSLNLALSLAGEVDRSVLLIDGDVAKGDLSRWMGIYDEPGLVDLLSAGSGSAEGAVIESNVDRLAVLSCGRPRENLDELYASELMLLMIDDLANSHPERIIVVDGPPLMPTTEASVLAGLMGQTVLVVEANQTPQTMVEQAVAQLKNSQLVSLLLNKVPQTEFEEYGYGYGYGQNTQPSSGTSNSAGAK